MQPAPVAQRNADPNRVFARYSDAPLLDSIEMLRFHLLYLGHAQVGPEWSTDAPYNDGSHHLHFVCSGRAQLRWPGHTLDLEPGHAYWTPAHVLVSRHCDRAYRHFFLVFRGEWLPGADLFWNCRAPVCLGTWNPREYAHQWQRGPLSLPTLLGIDALLRQLFARFAPLQDLIAEQQHLRGRFAPMFELLSRRSLPDASLQIGQIAAHMGMTHNGFSRLFRRQIGISPKAYLHRLLNQAACELLTTSDRPVRQIAADLNFTSEYYFNRFFRMLNGISPGRYRARASHVIA